MVGQGSAASDTVIELCSPIVRRSSFSTPPTTLLRSTRVFRCGLLRPNASSCQQGVMCQHLRATDALLSPGDDLRDLEIRDGGELLLGLMSEPELLGTHVGEAGDRDADDEDESRQDRKREQPESTGHRRRRRLVRAVGIGVVGRPSLHALEGACQRAPRTQGEIHPPRDPRVADEYLVVVEQVMGKEWTSGADQATWHAHRDARSRSGTGLHHPQGHGRTLGSAKQGHGVGEGHRFD